MERQIQCTKEIIGNRFFNCDQYVTARQRDSRNCRISYHKSDPVSPAHSVNSGDSGGRKPYVQSSCLDVKSFGSQSIKSDSLCIDLPSTSARMDSYQFILIQA